jgi:hypothetical protein
MQQMAYCVGRQLGLRSANDVIDQLTDQMRAAHAEYVADLVRIKQEFDCEVAELRRQLAVAQEQLTVLAALNEFSRWERSETDALN